MPHTKRIAIGCGKKPKWITTQKPGSHPEERSVPLNVVVRDILKFAQNAREASKIINSGMIIVNGKVRKDVKYNVGLMDVISIPKADKYYRVMPSVYGYGITGLVFKEIPEGEAKIKLGKITGKTIIHGGKVQLNMNNGYNIIVDDDNYHVNDVIVQDVLNGNIIEVLKFDKGKVAVTVSGRHAGHFGEIKETIKGTENRKSTTKLGDVNTLTDYIFVVGDKKPLITI